MAAGSDVRDILELESNQESEFVTKDVFFGDPKKKKVKKPENVVFKKPEGMHRELWGLLWTDARDAPPLMPSDSQQGYKQMKAKIGQSRVRPWKWMSFTNPARKDGAIFYHWRRVADEGADYPFARFNKQVEIPVYTDLEYQQHLHDDTWSREETDYLFELANRFDLRFVVMNDRWDRTRFPARSIEDLKERYYSICQVLAKVQSPIGGVEPKLRLYDADHERRRKDQLIKLFNRSEEEIEEEERLIIEMKRIEQRKKERDKKTQDLQKLIIAADSNVADMKRVEKKAGVAAMQLKKKVAPITLHQQQQQQQLLDSKEMADGTGMKFPDFKQPGASLRSLRMKLPVSLGLKRSKAVEQVVEELGIDANPIPTEEVVQHFNELRQDIVLLYELKLGLTTCEYELQTLRHQWEQFFPGKPLPVIMPEAQSVLDAAEGAQDSPRPRRIAESIDVLSTVGTPGRKRKIPLDPASLVQKFKQKFNQ